MSTTVALTLFSITWLAVFIGFCIVWTRKP